MICRRFALLLLALFVGCAARQPRSTGEKPIRVLVVTGGHGFQAAPFFKMFADGPALSMTAVTQGKAAEAYEREDLFSYDVLVLFDSPTDITEAQRARF